MQTWFDKLTMYIPSLSRDDKLTIITMSLSKGATDLCHKRHKAHVYVVRLVFIDSRKLIYFL